MCCGGHYLPGSFSILGVLKFEWPPTFYSAMAGSFAARMPQLYSRHSSIFFYDIG